MRKFIGLSVFVLTVVFFLGACAPTTAPTTQRPPEGEMKYDLYPLISQKHVMTEAEVQKLGLRVGKLEKPTFVFNHYRALGPKGGWKDEVLPAGTGVAQDDSGRAWYKLDCANRLFEPVSVCPICPIGSSPFGGGGRLPWLLPLLLLLPLLGLLGWLLGRWVGQRQRPPKRREPPPPGNGNGGNGRGDPVLGPLDRGQPPAAPPVDPYAARRAALEREIVEHTAKADQHKAEAARLSQEGRAATDDAEAERKLREAYVVRQAAVAARESAAAKQAELDALGLPPAPPTPVPQPAPTPAPPNDKVKLLVSLRTAEKKAGIRHRALRVVADALEADAISPAEARQWLGKLGITLA